MPALLRVDIGGTFTDLVVIDEPTGTAPVGKVLYPVTLEICRNRLIGVDGVARRTRRRSMWWSPEPSWRFASGRGGGYGPSAARDSDLIARDLLEGHVTRP
jgi:hypothetical protein